MSESQRYQGKPMLRLLEFYVLKAIDELSDEYAEKLAAMTPKLSQVYKHSGSWENIIAATMEFPAAMPAMILQMWKRNQEIAKAKGVILTPQQFAEMFVDQNLVS